MWKEEYKQKLGEYVVLHHVQDGMKVGLGSGSTAIYATRKLAELYRQGQMPNIHCCCTGEGTRMEALTLGLPCSFLDHPEFCDLDLAIDGADEYDHEGRVLKGGGGCHLVEKIVAYSATTCVIIVTEDKKVEHLGLRFPLPVEIIPSSRTRVEKALRSLLPIRALTLRRNARGVGPWITEEGNFIIDLHLREPVDPQSCEDSINTVVGVVENGFFTKRTMNIVSIDADGNIYAFA